MIALSVNVNKVATLRNARTPQPADRSAGRPSVTWAAKVCIDAGAPGITVHPRQDARHITPADVRELARLWADHPHVELNIEGDPRPDLLALAHEVRPTQLTLVPVVPGEVTSQAGWPPEATGPALTRAVADAKAAGIRVSLFVNPTLEAVDWAKDTGADRIELFTEPFARAFNRSREETDEQMTKYVAAAEHAHASGLGINAGHDLDLDNLEVFRQLPHLDEVSIGHALIADALEVGLAAAVAAYTRVLRS